MAFSIVYGNALEYEGDAVLNSLGTDGSTYGELCKSIIKGINRTDIKGKIDSMTDMRIGMLIETDGGDLKCAHVLHVVTPFREKDDDKCSELRKAYESVIDLAIKRGYKKIGLPFIGTGANGYTNGEVYDVLMDLLSEISEEEENSGKEIIDATVIAYLRRAPKGSKHYERRRRLINEAYIKSQSPSATSMVLNESIAHSGTGKQRSKKKEISTADLTYDILQFMADVDSEEMFKPNFGFGGTEYLYQYDFVKDYCEQKNLNSKRVLKEYDSRKRQKISKQYTLSKLDVYRFTVLLNLNKSEFVSFMTICGHMPSPCSVLDLFFINYMDGMFGPIGPQRTLFDMDKLFGLQYGIQFTIAGTESSAKAIRYYQKI